MSFDPSHIHDGMLRKATGLHRVRSGILETRDGSKLIDAPPSTAHSLFEFQGSRYAGVGTTLERDGAVAQGGFDGTNLTFAVMQTRDGTKDYLFVAGGGKVFAATSVNVDTPVTDGDVKLKLFSGAFSSTYKTSLSVAATDTLPRGVDYDGTNSPWAGTDDDKLYLQSGQFASTLKSSVALTTIDTQVEDVSYDGANSPWIGAADDKLYYQSGQFTATIKTSQAIGTVDTTATGITSDSADTETPWCGRTDDKLYLTSGQFSSTIRTSRTASDPQAVSLAGVDTPWCTNVGSKLFIQSGQFASTIKTSLTAAAFNNPVGISSNSFGSRTGGGTHALPAQQAKVDSAGTVTRWGIAKPDAVDKLALAVDAGGTNLNATYKYKFTYRNSTSGARSNPSASASVSPVNQAVKVTVGASDLSDDTQVDQIEVWRTVGGGSAYFLLARLNHAAQDFIDNAKDSELDGDEELPEDNQPPEATYEDAVGPHQGRMWWARDTAAGKQNRLYFSPIGRPESAGGGFIDLSADDDSIQKVVRFGGGLFVFTEELIYEVVSDDIPFTFRAIGKAPGTTEPFTVVATDVGIFYLSHDGIRFFDGISSRVISQGIERLFRGQDVDGQPPFEPTYAVFARGEYICSDGERTLALNLDTLTWRDLGIGVKAFYWEPDTDVIQASLNASGKIVELEAEDTLDDDGTEIEFDVETKHVRSDLQRGYVKRLVIDADTGGEEVEVELVADGVQRAFGDFATVQREEVEFPINRHVHEAGVRLKASATKRIRVFGVGLDMHQGRGV